MLEGIVPIGKLRAWVIFKQQRPTRGLWGRNRLLSAGFRVDILSGVTNSKRSQAPIRGRGDPCLKS
jgi:hypothetical protein